MLFRGPQKIVDFSYDPKGALGSNPTDSRIVHANNHSIPVQIGYRSPDDVAEQCVIQFEGLQQNLMALWLDGYISSVGGGIDSIALPVRIEWRLYYGVGGCMADQDPPTALTILKAPERSAGKCNREGRIFQVDCINAQTAWLCARVIEDIGRVSLNVSIKTIFWPNSGRPETIVGTAIG